MLSSEIKALHSQMDGQVYAFGRLLRADRSVCGCAVKTNAQLKCLCTIKISASLCQTLAREHSAIVSFLMAFLRKPSRPVRGRLNVTQCCR